MKEKKDIRALIIPIDSIAADEKNHRKTGLAVDEPAIVELSLSIREFGILQPLLVKPVGAGYQLISGHRRLVASRLAGLSEIPCKVYDGDDSKTPWMQLLENIQREDIKPLELSRAIVALLSDSGMSPAELGAKLGKSQPWVARAVTIAEKIALNDQESEGLTAEHLVTIASLPIDHQLSAANRIREQKINTADAKRLFANKKPSKKNAQSKPKRNIKTYETERATVTVEFKKSRVSSAEIVDALTSAIAQLRKSDSEPIAA